MSNQDYLTFRDNVLLAIAVKQNGFDVEMVDLDDLCHSAGLIAPPTWVQSVGADMVKQGWGTGFTALSGSSSFAINGAGLAKVAELRRERRPKTFVDRLAADRTQKLLNVGAFGVLLISLIVAAIALMKSGS